MQNAEIAAVLVRLADLLEIEGANPFRVRAYRNAAQTVEGLSRHVNDLLAEGEDLTALPGIGDDLARKIAEIAASGKLKALEAEQRRVPPTLADLLAVPTLGPRRVHAIWEKLHVADRKDLERAARSGALRELPGFGPAIEKRILEHLGRQRSGERRARWAVAEQLVESLVAHLRAVPGVGPIAAAGSYRRRMETVGDIDLLAISSAPEAVMRRFATFEDVAEVLSEGNTRSSVVLRSGLQADLRVVPEESYGAALYYFTGSKAHNIAVRTRAAAAGLKVNEYGVFRGETALAGRTEEDVFRAVGLPYIEPELRENRGEIEAAEAGRLPRLVRTEDLRGDLQSHTTESDGRSGLEEMAEAARARGYAYLAITDHSKRVAMAHGLNATRLARQIRAIDRLNGKFTGFRVLKSIEVDVLENGSLDLSDDILRELDLVVFAVHYGTALTRERQTERILRAMDNPLVHILAHPTGRLIGGREPYEVDMERVLDGARARGCFVEINAQPARLDLDDIHARLAKEKGVKVAISTDAHSAGELALMRHGVGQARRAWLEPDDVLNTRPWDALEKLLRRA